MAYSITDLKKNTVFEFNGEPYKVVEYSQKAVGRGGSIVNVKIKNLIDGKVLDKTFKGNEQLSSADISLLSAQYLYSDDQNSYFMNKANYEQIEVSKGVIGDTINFIKEGNDVKLQLFKNRVINLDIPNNLPLKVEYTESVVKGDTSSSITKSAKLETGLVIKVPAFIKQGDIVSVDTQTGNYRERIKI